MGDFPASWFWGSSGVISSLGGESSVSDVQDIQGATTAAAAWPSANRAVAVAFYLDQPATIVKASWINGGTVNGNVDVGVYDEQFHRLVSSGSTAQSGASVVQTVDIADTLLKPGTYFMALVSSSATATFDRSSIDLVLTRCHAHVQMATALPLPSTFVPAAPASSYVPTIVLHMQTTV